MAGEDGSPISQASQAILPPSSSYAQQMAAVKSGRYGSEELLMLLRESGATAGMVPNHERALLNEVMNRLRHLEESDSAFADILMEVASDTNRDPGVREYAVQQLLPWHAKTDQKAKVEDYLWKCAGDPAVSSTAILQLHHLNAASSTTLAHPLAPVVIRAMARPDLRDSDRVTLLLVAAESGMAEALPFARDWAGDTADQVVLRAALTAIGKLGGQQELLFLDQLKTSRNLDEVQETVEYTRNQLAGKATKGAAR